MDKTGASRRKHERFDLSFSSRIEAAGQERELQLFTRDISCCGAYFHTEQVIAEGAQVRVEIVVENSTLKNLTGYDSCIKVSGTVVRCDSQGMAIRFNGQEEISPVQSRLDN